MKKIAVPVENSRLCKHFGHCEQFFIASVNDQQIVEEEFLDPPEHQPGVYPLWLMRKGVTDVITGGVGNRAIALFNEHGIKLHVGAATKTPQELVQDFLDGTLQTSKNLCDH